MKKITLTKKQNEIVKSESDEMLIRGIAGSGKTVVILRKAVALAKDNPSKKVTIFSYNKALTTSAQYQIRDFELKNLEVKTFHSWAWGVLNSIKKRPIIIDSKIASKNFKNVIDEKVPTGHRFESGRKFSEFIKEEMVWIKGMGINNRNDYMQISRTGRGNDIRISKDDRTIIYDVFEAYEKLKGDKRDYDDYAVDLYRNYEQVNPNMKLDIVFVDEAQDLQMLQLKVLRELTKEKFIVAADKGQKIYTTSFTWKEIGLNITGNRTKILDETFRSTKQIVALAMSIQLKDSIREDEEFIESKLPVREGPKPIWYACKDYSSMVAGILHLASELNDGKVTIGILGHKWQILNKLEYQLRNNGLYPEKIKKEEGNTHKPGVKLTTFHSAKGLEFDYVIIATEPDEPNLELDPDLERRLYYVSMTRAKAGLFLFTEPDYPKVLDELDRNLYVRN